MLNFSRRTRAMAGVMLAAMSQICAISVANAQGAIVTGHVMLVEGHEGPTCRRLRLRLGNGSELWFRLPDTGVDNSILAVGLTAIATGKKVDLAYIPGLGSGCGTEPKVNWISLLAE